ncbi:fumarylacetoacetate hydrolase family protein, partial [Virgibacillus sp. W0181]
MKILTIRKTINSIQTLGIRTEKGIIDIERALMVQPNKDITPNIMDVIQGGQSTISKLESYIQDLPEDKSYMIAENEVSFGPAVTAPNKIICV